MKFSNDARYAGIELMDILRNDPSATLEYHELPTPRGKDHSMSLESFLLFVIGESFLFVDHEILGCDGGVQVSLRYHNYRDLNSPWIYGFGDTFRKAALNALAKYAQVHGAGAD